MRRKGSIRPYKVKDSEKKVLERPFVFKICILFAFTSEDRDKTKMTTIKEKKKKEGHSCGIIGNTDIQMVAITVIHVLDILLVCSIDRKSCHV